MDLGLRFHGLTPVAIQFHPLRGLSKSHIACRLCRPRTRRPSLPRGMGGRPQSRCAPRAATLSLQGARGRLLFLSPHRGRHSLCLGRKPVDAEETNRPQAPAGGATFNRGCPPSLQSLSCPARVDGTRRGCHFCRRAAVSPISLAHDSTGWTGVRVFPLSRGLAPLHLSGRLRGQGPARTKPQLPLRPSHAAHN